MSLYKKFLQGLLLVLATLVLSACGFHLQGDDSYPESLSMIYIDAGDRYTDFYRGLRTRLDRGGVDIVSAPKDGVAIIRIERDETGQRVLTVSARNVPTEYDVYYTIQYSVIVDGEVILPLRTITLREDYTYDATQVLGKKREEDELRRSLVSNLVRQVSQQLSRL